LQHRWTRYLAQTAVRYSARPSRAAYVRVIPGQPRLLNAILQRMVALDQFWVTYSSWTLTRLRRQAEAIRELVLRTLLSSSPGNLFTRVSRKNIILTHHAFHSVLSDSKEKSKKGGRTDFARLANDPGREKQKRHGRQGEIIAARVSQILFLLLDLCPSHFHSCPHVVVLLSLSAVMLGFSCFCTTTHLLSIVWH
jgi:hypothetical protein